MHPAKQYSVVLCQAVVVTHKCIKLDHPYNLNNIPKATYRIMLQTNPKSANFSSVVTHPPINIPPFSTKLKIDPITAFLVIITQSELKMQDYYYEII